MAKAKRKLGKVNRSFFGVGCGVSGALGKRGKAKLTPRHPDPCTAGSSVASARAGALALLTKAEAPGPAHARCATRVEAARAAFNAAEASGAHSDYVAATFRAGQARSCEVRAQSMKLRRGARVTPGRKAPKRRRKRG